VRAHRAWEVVQDGPLRTRHAELAPLVDDLVRVRGEAVEAIEQVARIVARPGQRQVLAGAPIQLRHAFATHRVATILLVLAPVEDQRELRFELAPLGLVQAFEVQWGH
jgi:hypothetical protein